MLVNLCLIIFAVVAVQKGLCLKCYACLSEDIYDSCYRFDKTKVPLKTCDRQELENTKINATKMHGDFEKLFEVDAAQEPLPPLNCLKQVVKRGSKHYVLRGCQLATSNNLDICVKVKKEIDKDLLQTTYCSLCNGDRCNAGFVKRPLVSLYAIFLAAFVTFSIY